MRIWRFLLSCLHCSPMGRYSAPFFCAFHALAVDDSGGGLASHWQIGMIGRFAERPQHRHRAYDKHVATVEQIGGINSGEFTKLNHSLVRLERFWTDQIRYRL